MRSLPVLIFAGVSLLLLLSQDAFACQCGGLNTPYTVYAKADAVFVGKVVAVTDAAGIEFGPDKLHEVQREAFMERKDLPLNYRFQIQERFKGAEISELTVQARTDMCQFGFGIGVTYIIYAYKSGDPKATFETGIFCSRNDSLPGGNDDVHFLRGLLKGEPEPRIYGSVQVMEKDPSGNGTRESFLEGIEIVATSGRKRFTTATDKNGFYRFDKLPNGKYKVAPKLPDRYEAVEWLNDDEVTLTDGRPDDHLFNTAMYEGFRGRNAFVELNVTVRKQFGSKQK